MSTKKIVFVICYFGKWPPWISIFLNSCKENPKIDFLIFTDCGDSGVSNIVNVKFVHFTIADFNRLASQTLKLPVQILVPYKVCDFKPVYGIIFQNYLQDYDFWGHTDTDLIFGNIDKFITDKILSSYDVITAKKQYLLGHFTLYKNTAKINSLYKLSKDHESVFTTGSEYFCFDECGFLWFYLLQGHPLTGIEPKVVSMTHIVKQLHKKKYLRAYFQTHMVEQDQIDENGVVDFEDKLIWNKGELHSATTGKKYLYFHFHFLKTDSAFKIPGWTDFPRRFSISAKGFALIQ